MKNNIYTSFDQQKTLFLALLDASKKYGKHYKIIEDIKSIKFEELFIQIGVQDTADEKFRRLDSLYKRHAFQRTNFSIDHGNGRSFYDYFWSPREFRVQQRGGQIAPVHI